MHPAHGRRRANQQLQNVKWRFLSEAALGPTNGSKAWSEGPKKRIGHLEKALASTHDLEAQYQSFMQEVARTDPSGTIFDGVGPGWGGARALGGVDPSEADLIPSDPLPELPSAMGAGVATAGAGAPEAGAPHAAADGEVATVQARGNASAANDDTDADRDSPSPIIIWRHAAPVKIATNVPPDLLEGGDRGAEARSPVSSGRLRGGSYIPDGAPRPSPQPPVPAVDPRREAAKGALSRRMAYGMWYLPKEQWESRAHAVSTGAGSSGEDLDPKGGGAKGSGAKGSGAKGGGADEGTGSDLAEVIPKLYSSRIYKDFLKSQSIRRMPKYLEGVESTEEDATHHRNANGRAGLSAKRGHIPMLEGGGEVEGTS